MSRYIVKQIRRSAVTNALFCLLLTLSGTLLCISAGLWYSAHKALTDIDEIITTIAVPNRFAVNLFSNMLAGEKDFSDFNDDIYAYTSAFSDAVLQAERDVIRTMREDIYSSDLVQTDKRRLFGAVSDGINSIPMRTTVIGAESYLAAYSGQALAAFVVSFDRYDAFYWTDSDPMQNDGTVLKFSYAVLLIDDVLHLHPVHTEHSMPRYLRIQFFRNHDGSLPFEPGKQYVVFGRFLRSAGIGDLTLEVPAIESDHMQVGTVESNAELQSMINWWRFTFGDEMFPLRILEYYLVREPDENDGWYSSIEIKSNLNETMASEQWVPMQESLESAEISGRSFQVLTTDNPNSFMRFNQNRNLFSEGRSFTSQEIATGARVCLVTEQFAEYNDLNVGDTLPIQFYNMVLGSHTGGYSEGESGRYVTSTFWIPSLYHKGLELSTPTEFTIVGIVNTLRQDRTEYAILPNTVIIPNNSFTVVLEGEPFSDFDTSGRSPLLADGMIVPNGRISETREIINNIAPGFGGLFRFFDQGYDSLKLALGNLRFGMSWILAMSASGWIAVLIIFQMFYVTRKRKEAALLYAIGVNKVNRFFWVFIQCSVLVLIALGISIAVSLPLYGDILEIAAGTAQAFTDSFRDLTLSDAADSGLRSKIPLERSPGALIVTVTGGALITFIIAGLLTGRSVAFKSMGEKRGDD